VNISIQFTNCHLKARCDCSEKHSTLLTFFKIIVCLHFKRFSCCLPNGADFKPCLVNIDTDRSSSSIRRTQNLLRLG